MARKKIIFIIVEGPSNDEALGVIWNRLYDKNVVHLEIVHGDITSDRAVVPENIAAKIGNLVRDYAKSNHYRASDFQEVIHLIDMDGAFIPKDAVIKNSEMEKPFLIFISDSEFSVCRSFKESWEYIKREKHSLERHTNLGICFQNIRQTDIKNKQNIHKIPLAGNTENKTDESQVDRSACDSS